ncbi:3',5'-cyclic-AMP phosphodiesterase [Vibrio mediterranei]|uniref:3',5'-cyclic-AMP phosphodiesterase n=1 Tax=Vibrio TaxID=662 RepID=UPI00148DD1C4|nr:MULTISPECIES: 3',5'-cyclic-AMP phosphodiesterase [Vibrio]MCF4174096.1 3',5'-cyclic-AMP phosphodiesterase [Vibrio sp. McD22-P3]NOI23160.1 3',5'-cyclic-AMP phosphodiesterase [Vibrio mediterranei]
MKTTPSDESQLSSVRLLQLTDTHLFAPQDGCLLSVNTQESFNAVVAEIVAQGTQFDALLATGDISQDHTEASYEKFVAGIEPLALPCYWLPGNHDYKPCMNSVVNSPLIQDVTHVLLGEKWQVVLLDSQVVGVPHGRLSDSQLEFLDRMLSTHCDRHTLVLLHHHPLLVNSAWLDQHSLKDADEFWNVVEKHDNVRAVLCGHIHQELDEMRGGVRVLATPSTCVQFKPNSNEFALDVRSPGWRELELREDGRLHTEVKRLANGSFRPDFNAEGY